MTKFDLPHLVVVVDRPVDLIRGYKYLVAVVVHRLDSMLEHHIALVVVALVVDFVVRN